MQQIIFIQVSLLQTPDLLLYSSHNNPELSPAAVQASAESKTRVESGSGARFFQMFWQPPLPLRLVLHRVVAWQKLWQIRVLQKAQVQSLKTGRDSSDN
jgi:hypothetical protein